MGLDQVEEVNSAEPARFMGWLSQGMWSKVQLQKAQYVSEFTTWDNTFIFEQIEYASYLPPLKS